MASYTHIKNFGHIMVDLETLSTHTNAAIIEIAAVEFNINTGKIGDTFHQIIDKTDWGENNRHIDGSTLLWWMGQDKELISKYKKSGIKLHSALYKFREFYNQHSLSSSPTVLWGNGATFDITILQSAYEYFKEPTPWQYWTVNDVRTIVNLNTGIKENCVFEGIKHNPIDDCKHQIKYLVEILKTI